jgi:vancomycin resistance protein YoaR
LVEDLPGSDRPAGRRRFLYMGGAVVAVLGVAYVGLVAASGEGLPRGTHVQGVDVGGQSEQQAAATLTTQLGPRASKPIDAVVGTDHVSFVPADSGLSFDAAATVHGLGGRIWNPITLLSQFAGGPNLTPVLTVDDAKLAEAVKTVAGESDSPPREPAIVVRGRKVTLNPGANGRVLDQKASVAALASAYFVSSDSVTLPVVEAQPTVSSDAAGTALAAAEAAVAAPVGVTIDTVSTSIPAATIAEALSYSVKNGALVPALKGDVLRAAIAPSIASVETPGRDATWDVSSGKPVVVPSKVGKGVNADLLAQDVVKVLDKNGTERSVKAEIGTIDPKLTTEQAKALGVTEQMSSFTQHFPYAAYRVQNIGQAARSINKTLLLPGGVFSLNKTLGERTVANGYTKGYVIGPGGVFKEDLGGGVSTSATATWTAAFYAGLERIHAQAHSIWISRYRAGLEATVAWGSFDMSFKNDTPHGVFITTIMKNTSITVTIWGTKVYDEITAVSGPRTDLTPFTTVYDNTPTCHAQGGEPGFSIDVWRVFMKGGVEVKREKFTTHYRPGPNVICGNDPTKATPSPSPSGSPTGKPSPSPTPTPTKKPSPSPTPKKS